MVNVQLSMFLDRSRVFAAMDRKKQRILSRTGAYTMGVMRKMQRYSRSTSMPGAPPNARKNNPLMRERTFFGFDERSESVVIGPEHFKTKVRTFGLVASSRTPVPQLLNEGGSATLISPTNKVTRATYAPRPFTAPSMTKGIEKLQEETERTPF